MRYYDSAIVSKDLFFVDTCGFSMWPFLRQGDKVIAKKTSLENLNLGDIIIYVGGLNKKICHRLVKKVKSGDSFILYTRGDSIPGRSEVISAEKVLGKVIGIMRNGRIISQETKKAKTVNWLIANFYAPVVFWRKFFKNIVIYFFSLIQNTPVYKISLGFLISPKVEYRLPSDLELDNQFVALYRGKVIGSVCLTEKKGDFQDGSFLVSGLHVRIRFRRLGVGEKLMERLIEFARKKGINNLYLNVQEKAKPGYLLYKKLGFKENGETIASFYLGNKSQSYLIMERKLID